MTDQIITNSIEFSQQVNEHDPDVFTKVVFELCNNKFLISIFGMLNERDEIYIQNIDAKKLCKFLKQNLNM